MVMLRPLAYGAISAALFFTPGLLPAQNYPTRLIRVLAPEPGGGGDFVARLVAQELARSLGQQVIVEKIGRAHV